MQNNDRPLVVAAEGPVLDEIQRLAAAVGCDADQVADLEAARGRWTEAPLVLVDDAVAGAAAGLPKRDDVLLVCAGKPPPSAWRRAFLLGAEDVVALPDTDGVLVTALADVAEGPSPQRGRVLAVVGGRGGAGASVLAAAVALGVAKSGGDALLVDCDSLGGGIDLVLGAELEGGLRWPELRVQAGRVSMAALDDALPGIDHGAGRLAVLSCDRDGPGPAPDAVAAVVAAGTRAGRVVVCDLPREPGPSGDQVLRLADLVVLVVPAELRACVAASRVLANLGDSRGRVRVLARGPSLDGLTGRDVADAVGAPLLGWLRPDRRLAKALERGSFNPRRRSSLGAATRAVLDELHAA